jgi:hypothetical protein
MDDFCLVWSGLVGTLDKNVSTAGCRWVGKSRWGANASGEVRSTEDDMWGKGARWRGSILRAENLSCCKLREEVIGKVKNRPRDVPLLRAHESRSLDCQRLPIEEHQKAVPCSPIGVGEGASVGFQCIRRMLSVVPVEFVTADIYDKNAQNASKRCFGSPTKSIRDLPVAVRAKTLACT